MHNVNRYGRKYTKMSNSSKNKMGVTSQVCKTIYRQYHKFRVGGCMRILAPGN